MELYTARALKKLHLVQTRKFQASKVHILVKNLLHRYHPNWISICHPLDDVNRVKVYFQSSTPPIIPSHMY